eukprot:350306-Chlamydomonas_euryale.AAC.7
MSQASAVHLQPRLPPSPPPHSSATSSLAVARARCPSPVAWSTARAVAPSLALRPERLPAPARPPFFPGRFLPTIPSTWRAAWRPRKA